MIGVIILVWFLEAKYKQLVVSQSKVTGVCLQVISGIHPDVWTWDMVTIDASVYKSKTLEKEHSNQPLLKINR